MLPRSATAGTKTVVRRTVAREPPATKPARTVERQPRQPERCPAFDYLGACHYLSADHAAQSAEDATINRYRGEAGAKQTWRPKAQQRHCSRYADKEPL